MQMMTYRPWRLIDRLHSDLDRLFETQLAQGDENSQTLADWVPSVDIKEEEQQFLLRADLPGVDPKEIEITMENGVLTLRGQRFEERRDEKTGYRRVERVVGQFFRRFTLPDSVDAEGISAKSRDGVLELSIPKLPKRQPKRITIDAA